MIGKRFTYEYDEYNGNLFDNKMNTFYHIEDSDENIEVLCDRLNWLVEENEQLKRRIQRERNSFMKTQERWSKEAEAKIKELSEENEQLKKENEKLELLWEKKCIKEYMGIVGEYALQEMHNEKYGDK